MKDVASLWDSMREKFQTMSLQELAHVNLPRQVEALKTIMPEPPYDFRQRTMEQRVESVTSNHWVFKVDVRDDWHFTGALAMPAFQKKLDLILSGADEDAGEKEDVGKQETLLSSQTWMPTGRVR